MRAVSEDGEALQYATERLRSDREIVLRAVSQDMGFCGHWVLWQWDARRAPKVMKAGPRQELLQT